MVNSGLHLHYYATCHEDDYITGFQSRNTKQSDGEKKSRYSRRMELRRSCSKSAAERKVLPDNSAGDSAGLKSEPGVAALFSEARQLSKR